MSAWLDQLTLQCSQQIQVASIMLCFQILHSKKALRPKKSWFTAQTDQRYLEHICWLPRLPLRICRLSMVKFSLFASTAPSFNTLRRLLSTIVLPGLYGAGAVRVHWKTLPHSPHPPGYVENSSSALAPRSCEWTRWDANKNINDDSAQPQSDFWGMGQQTWNQVLPGTYTATEHNYLVGG
jgi:hypothetical protein